MVKEQNFVLWIKKIIYIKTNDIYKYIEVDAETRFGTSTYELDRPLPKARKYENFD